MVFFSLSLSIFLSSSPPLPPSLSLSSLSLSSLSFYLVSYEFWTKRTKFCLIVGDRKIYKHKRWINAVLFTGTVVAWYRRRRKRARGLNCTGSASSGVRRWFPEALPVCPCRRRWSKKARPQVESRAVECLYGATKMVKCGREWVSSEDFDSSNHDRGVGRVSIHG